MKKHWWPVSGLLLLIGALACGGGAASPPAQPGEQAVGESACGLRAGANLRMRTCPDPSLRPIGLMPQDSTSAVVARSEDAYWWEIEYSGGTAWVYGGWATLLGDCTAVPVSTACDTTTPASRGQAPASGGEAQPPADSGAAGTGAVCGDANCDASGGEDCATCPADCGGCGLPGADGTLCGDGVCQEGESDEWCGDCVASEVEIDTACGDGACNFPAEDCLNCPDDCTICSIEAFWCGDGECSTDLGEDCSTCDADCGTCAVCGDGICQGDEAISCSEDCARPLADCEGEECGADVNQLWGDWEVVGPDGSLGEDLAPCICGDGSCSFYERFPGDCFCPQDC